MALNIPRKRRQLPKGFRVARGGCNYVPVDSEAIVGASSERSMEQNTANQRKSVARKEHIEKNGSCNNSNVRNDVVHR
jgi:hypothetical protein